jgi:hypothetical protein
MKAFQEITEWDTDFVMPNHVYFLSDSKDKMYGYVKSGTGKILEVATPYRFHTRGRKFKEVENTWNFSVDDAPEPATGREYRVTGSGRNIYTVTDNAGSWSCTCPASKWQKGNCKHIKGLLESLL